MGSNSTETIVWKKSSLSDNGNACVEVAFSEDEVHVRDSKNPMQMQLHFTIPEWDAFLGGVARGEFTLDRLASRSRTASPAARERQATRIDRGESDEP